MATLLIPGIPDPRPDASELGRGLPAGMVRLKTAVRVESGRAAVDALRVEGVQPDDIVEIELEDGLRLWSRVDDLERDFGLQRSRGAAEGIIEMPARLAIGPPSRGWAAWGIKALKVVGIDIAKSIADFAADHVEGTLKPGPGLYRCSDTDAAALTAPGTLTGAGPTLVFLHGTASSTSGSFGELWKGGTAAPIRRLFAAYGGRVLALQHETLTKSPIENALVAAQRLLEVIGRDAEIHLVSHSRGGLIGELLARGMREGGPPFTQDDLALFEAAERVRDHTALAALSLTLQEARFRFTRFVRVACPARGTTLADGRLDRYFSVLVNAVGLIPGLKANPVYDGLTSLLAGVLKQRTKPEDLPGLEAQMPGSPLVLMLNQPGVTTAADLHVLGGDLEGTGIVGRLKTFATDLYYREDHDLVVNTPAMFGGAERRDGIRYWIDTGNDVTHFNYFARPDTATRLVAALTSGHADFHDLQAAPSVVTMDDYRKRALVPQPVVFVLPGIMGSELTVAGESVWMKMFALAMGGLAALRTGANVTATGLIHSGYGDLCRFLAATHEVVPFPYDWRLSIEESAERLRAALDARLPEAEAQDQPVRILAHSMGGLVVRAMLATEPGRQTWARMCKHAGARFIMLGTPNRGSHAMSAMLIGRDALVKKLALVDVKHDYAGLLETIAGFQGVLELLPYAGALDLLETAGWQALFDNDVPSVRGLFSSSVASSKSAGFAWTRPAAAALARARTVRDKIVNSPVDPARMLYVAGVADETACDIVVDTTASAGRRVRVLASAHGDGRVLWKTGIPTGLRTFYMDAMHGDLASTEDAFPALLDLLTTGTTAKLPSLPPARRAAVDEVVELRDPLPAMVPDREELIASALGGRRRRTRRASAERRRVQVRVVHDDLSNATSPVLVGHYEHDIIFGAEAYLDRQLSRRLSELSHMDLYPGPIGTAVVALNEQGSGQAEHPGAIVAGLGMVGDLTSGRLTMTLAQALTMYGAERVGLERRRRQREREGEHAAVALPVAVTALLVGSSDAGVSVADSILALLRAVTAANGRLAMRGPQSETPTLTAWINRVDIIEVYADRAIDAVHALRSLARSTEVAEAFLIEDTLTAGNGRRRRARFDAPQGWWQRVRVTEADGGLRLEALTQIARVPAHIVPTQRQAVEALLKRVTATTAFDPALGYTLFEMLVPNDFKLDAPDRRDLVLVLDPGAATVPWELMHNRYERGGRPLAVASGMVRQLLDDIGREQIVRAASQTALVVGDPVVTDRRFPSLPGAAAEATAVATVLAAANYDVTALIGAAATPTTVFTAVHEKPWRILHLAAHGVFNFVPAEGHPPVSGLVLGDRMFFTAGDAEQIRHVPDIVFINCCHLGQTAGEAPLFGRFHELAANLAVQFIRMGVRAVVAAGWAVDDAAARAFAETFYTEMLAGSHFGQAVGRARARIYEQYGGQNTWGAYQCYGDPGFSLSMTSAPSRDEPPVAELEVVIAAEDIARRARTEDRAKLLIELEAVARSVPQAWLASPTLRAALGEAYGELEQFEPAIRHYEAIQTARRADAPIRALEQLANLRVRWARSMSEADPSARRAALQQIDSAETLFNALIVVGETTERYSMLGSLHKRRAMLTTGDARRLALANMRKAYARSYEVGRASGPSAIAYPLANQLAADVVLAWPLTLQARKAALESLDEGLMLLKDAALELSLRSTDFFDLSAQADYILLAALKTGALEPGAREMVETQYVRAGLRGVSPRERASAADQIVFYEEMAGTEAPAATREPLIAALKQLRRALVD